MKLVFISDTHSLHDSISIPDGDVFIHCGDFLGNNSWQKLEEFNAFLGSLKHQTKIVIAGNHDGLFEKETKEAIKVLTNANYLQDSSITIQGIKFYGSPWTPVFFDWFFMAESEELKPYWEKIPSDVDVLITHGPPNGIHDRTVDGVNAGCPELLKRVTELNPKIHAFGHIHEGYGVTEINGSKFINASSLDENYRAVNAAVVVEI